MKKRKLPDFDSNPEDIIVAALALRRTTRNQLVRASVVAFGGIFMVAFNLHLARFYNTWMWLFVAFFGGSLFEQMHQCWMLMMQIRHCDHFIENAVYTMQKEGLLTESIPPWRIRERMVSNLKNGSQHEIFDPFLPKPGEFN